MTSKINLMKTKMNIIFQMKITITILTMSFFMTKIVTSMLKRGEVLQKLDIDKICSFFISSHFSTKSLVA